MCDYQTPRNDWINLFFLHEIYHLIEHHLIYQWCNVFLEYNFNQAIHDLQQACLNTQLSDLKVYSKLSPIFLHLSSSPIQLTNWSFIIIIRPLPRLNFMHETASVTMSWFDLMATVIYIAAVSPP